MGPTSQTLPKQFIHVAAAAEEVNEVGKTQKRGAEQFLKDFSASGDKKHQFEACRYVQRVFSKNRIQKETDSIEFYKPQT